MNQIKNLFQLALYVLLKVQFEDAYEIAPITDDMRQASQAIVAALLPEEGVTETSSVAWSRLAYICGKKCPFICFKFITKSNF